MKMFFVLIVSLIATGCAATDSKGNRMSPFEGLAATGEYLGSIWTPGYKTPQSGQYESALDGIERVVASRGYSTSNPRQKGDRWLEHRHDWRSIGRQSSYAGINIGFYTDCWTYEDRLIWYDKNGTPQFAYYGESGFGGGISVGAGTSIEARGIDWDRQFRRQQEQFVPKTRGEDKGSAYSEGIFRPRKERRKR